MVVMRNEGERSITDIDIMPLESHHFGFRRKTIESLEAGQSMEL
jgi:hypothetical protein